MNPSSRLSPRLNAILELVKDIQQQGSYPYVWDCCCDHGYLGVKILQDELCEKLIFVDKLPHIIDQLSTKLAPFDTGKHELMAADAGDLDFDAQQRHLVILAGVGGETTVKILSAIKLNHSNVQIDYIFCPSTSQKALRAYLRNENFGLDFEDLVCENRRYYEVMFVRGNTASNGLPRVSLNCDIWDMNDPEQQRYLDKINAPRGSKKRKR